MVLTRHEATKYKNNRIVPDIQSYSKLGLQNRQYKLIVTI